MPYRMITGLRLLKPEQPWLELDCFYDEEIKLRRSILETRGPVGGSSLKFLRPSIINPLAPEPVYSRRKENEHQKALAVQSRHRMYHRDVKPLALYTNTAPASVMGAIHNSAVD